VPAPEILFYDGGCGLCHRAVRFVLAFDRAGEVFRFAPLFGRTFLEQVPEAERAGLPDSLVLRTQDGRLLTKSAAVLHLLRRLGGFWRLVAAFGGVVPRVLRDALYDLVARVRLKLFARPDDVCPLVPKEQRARFLP
jgi:predicted DCC family thiol-disulfide oxidoreductase YuxK